MENELRNGGIRTELLRFAFKGVNIVPTMLLILTQVYWLLASFGLMDIDFFDIDLDVDVEGAEASGLLNALALFLNIGQVPITLVMTMLAFNFWFLGMLTYFIPITHGGLISGILLFVIFFIALLETKYQVQLLKMGVFEKRGKNDVSERVLNKRCVLKSDLVSGQLGQALIEENKTSIVINVKTKFDEDSFTKDERAFVLEKDQEKEVYYIRKF